jgi:hypothetical protein
MLLGISGLHGTCFLKFQVSGILFWKGIKRHYLYQKTLKNLQKNRCGILTMYVYIQLPALEHSWSISTGNSLTALLTALILFLATTACLPTQRTGLDHSTLTMITS